MPAGLLVIVPARGGSKRLPGKNLMPLAGRSLIARVADFAGAEGILAETLLSTDDEKIAAEGRRAGLAVPFLRPASLAGDATPTFDVVAHAIEWASAQRGALPEFVAVLQPTSPFRRPGLFAEALGRLRSERGVAAVVAMSRLHVGERFLFRQSTGASVEPLGTRTDPVLAPSGALYLGRTAAVLAARSLYPTPVGAIETSSIEAVDIDTEDDFRLAEAMIAAGLAR